METNWFFILLLAIHTLLLIYWIVRKKFRRITGRIRPVIDINFLYIMASIIAIFLITGCWYLAESFKQHTIEDLQERREIHLKEIGNTINGELSAIDNAVKTLAGSPWIQSAAANPSGDNLNRANSVLDRYNTTQNASVCFLLDLDGNVIASSNRNSTDSFLGNNYSFRPYFIQARNNKPGDYFALGITSGKRGYYSSAPVMENNKLAGIAVIKKDIDFIESGFNNAPYLFLVNREGIIFIAGKSTYQYRSLWPATEEVREKLMLSRQFGTINFTPLMPAPVTNNGVYKIDKKFYFCSILPLIKADWSLVSFSSTERINFIVLISYVLTLFLVLTVYLFIVVIIHYKTKLWVEQAFLSEQRFQKIFKYAPGILIIFEKKTFTILALSDSALEMLEYKEAELIGADITLILKEPYGNKPPENAEMLNKVNFLYSRSGKKNEVIVSTTDLVYEGKECLLLFANDIQVIRKAEQALVENEQLYREMLDTLPQIIYECTGSGDVIYVNKYGLAYFGFPDGLPASDLSMLDFINHSDHKRALADLEKINREKCHIIDDYEFMRNNGTTFTGLVHSVPVIKNENFAGFRGFISDISKQKEEEAEKNRNSKLESIGILAGGLAHDFNNILTSISNGIHWIDTRYEKDEELKNLNTELIIAINHGKEITQQLLTFSRGGAPVKETTSVIMLIKDTADFILSGSNCKCDYHFPDGLWPVDIDKAQFSQVIQNLILNAAQAMPAGGIIRINAENISITEVFPISVPAGNYVKLTVEDSGCGIPREILPNIFDPFFTTREKGKGLGLATVHSIIQKHNGFIFAESSPGAGTCFTIFLPAARGIPRAETDEMATVKKGGGRILLMDDDKLVLKTCERLLNYLGYRVETVTNGTRAITAYTRALSEQDPFDVVIMDLTIKGDMGGKETLAKLKAIDNTIKAIVSSGYSNDPVMANYRDYGFAGVISKPYRLDKMSILLNEVINQKP